MSKFRGKRKPVSTTVIGKDNNLDIACAFSDHYNDCFNCVNYNIEDMDNLDIFKDNNYTTEMPCYLYEFI